jgi:hypothetical protein
VKAKSKLVSFYLHLFTSLRYKEMTSEIADIYANAKKGHAKGIVLLQDEFGYHVPFKRPGDTFTAVAFRPA